MILEAMNDKKAKKMRGSKALTCVKNYSVFKGTIDWSRFGTLMSRLVNGGTADDWWAIHNLTAALGTPLHRQQFELAYAEALVPVNTAEITRVNRDRKTPLAPHIALMRAKKQATQLELILFLKEHGIQPSRALREATGLKSSRLSYLMAELAEQGRVRRHDGYFKAAFGNGHGAGWEAL